METHTVCATTDGVTLRLVVDGTTFFAARSVKYAPQKAELFQVPPNYAPALAPAGGAEPIKKELLAQAFETFASRARARERRARRKISRRQACDLQHGVVG